MTTINLAVLTAILLSPLGAFCLAQETATTKDGRQVVLNPDGRWQYMTNTTEATSSSAIQTLRLYLSATSLQNRIPFVLNPEKVGPLMKIRYEGKPWRVPQFEILTHIEPTPSPTGWVKIEACGSRKSGFEWKTGRTMIYYLKMTDSGFRIDWETSIGFNPVSPEEFRVTKPTTPVRFRGYAKLEDFYADEFSKSKNIAYSIYIRNGDEQGIGHGYIMKNTIAGQKLFEILRDGKEHQMVVDLQYLPNAQDGYYFMITAVLSYNGWLYDEAISNE